MRDIRKKDVLHIVNADVKEPDKDTRNCILDEDLACPPSRYDCARPCPYTGWERRMARGRRAG
jgi:hypothetical protein